MLYFYDARVFYNIELGTIHNPYYATSIPYCNNEDAETQFPNIKLFESVTQTDIQFGNHKYSMFLITPGQFRGFVRDYVNHSMVNKLYNWDADSFFMEYFSMMKAVASTGAEHDYHGKWLEDDTIYNTILTTEITDMEVPTVETSPIVIDHECKPELSLRIEDALYAVKNGGTSLYTSEINELIKYNINKLAFCKDLFSSFYNTTTGFENLNLSSDITIDTIDYTQENSILYFYFYSFLPGVRTNFYHLKRVLEEMRK